MKLFANPDKSVVLRLTPSQYEGATTGCGAHKTFQLFFDEKDELILSSATLRRIGLICKQDRIFDRGKRQEDAP